MISDLSRQWREDDANDIIYLSSVAAGISSHLQEIRMVVVLIHCGKSYPPKSPIEPSCWPLGEFSLPAHDSESVL